MSLDTTSMQHQAPACARRTHVWRTATTLAVALMILALPFARHWPLLRRPPSEIYYEFTSFVFYLSDAAVILLLAMAVLWLWREEASVVWKPAAITIPLALLPALALVTAPWAGDAGLAIYTATRLMGLLGVYLAIVALQPSTRVIQLSLAASLVLQTAIAATQFVAQDDLGWRWLGEIDLNPTSGFASVIVVGSRVWLRGYGLTPHPNILGGILAAALLALSVSYLRRQGWQRIGWLAVLIAGGVGLVATFSRAAWLGALAGALLLLLGVLTHRPWRQKYARAILVPVIIGVVVLAGFATVRRDLFIARLTPSATPTESRSLGERRILNDMSLKLIRCSPLTGVGAGNFSTAVAPLMDDIPETTPQPVHNLSLLLSAELGVAGGVLWIWLMLAPLTLAWQRFRTAELSLWALGLTAALVALAVVDLFDFYSWGWPQGRLLRWVYLALWSGALNTSAS